MTTALIDNATVSSVQRALGKAKLRDPGVLDVEHAALGRFSEAVLLCDGVAVPDNYKDAFTAARKKLLEDLKVQFVPVPAELDDSLNTIANSLSSPWHHAYKEGQERELLQLYFKQIQAFSKFIWEHSSSAFFLVFRTHGIEKGNPLIDALLSSPNDEILGKELQIVAADGHPVEWKRLSPHVQRMLSVMGWLGHQYIWHQAFAAKHDFSYMPHPLRDFFANDFLSRVEVGSTSAVAFESVFSSSIEKFRGTLRDGLDKLGVARSAVKIQLPALLPLLAKESSSGDDFMRTLVQMRSESQLTELREMLSHAQRESSLGNYTPLSKLVRDIESIGQTFLLERGIERRIVSIAPPTTLVGIKVEGDDSALRMRMPSVLYKQFFLRRRYRAFIRDVMAEIAAPAQYGLLKTRMNSWAWISDESEFAHGSRFYTKDYRFPSKYHKPLDHNSAS